MKNLINAMAGIGVVLGLWSTPAISQDVGPTFAQAQASKSAEVTCLFTHTPGFVVQNENGRMEGILVDLLTEFQSYVKTRRGIALTFKFERVPNDNFQELMERVKASEGAVLGVSNITITEERQNVYDFSTPYISNISVLISHPSVPEVTNLGEISRAFAGKTAYAAPGTTHENRLLRYQREYLPNMQIVPMMYETVILDKVAADPNAFASTDFIFYANALKNNIRVKRHPAGDGESEQFGLALSKNNDWTAMMNEFLNSGYLKSSGYRKRISDHLGYHALSLLSTLSQ
ncbi:MAG: transporter substrate-binding domain-containing protein [Bacteroidota bacterium]